MFNIKTAEYFEKRALHVEQSTKNLSDKFLKDLEKEYKKAYKEIDIELKKYHERYLNETDGTAIDLNKPLSGAELADYCAKINKTIETAGLSDELSKTLQKRYLHGQYSRLKALQNQIELQLEILRRSTDLQTFEHLKETYKESYYETADMLTQADVIANKKVFVELSNAALNINAIEKVVKNPWSEKSFSQRIWKNNKKAIREVKSTLATGLMQGHSVDKMSRKLSKKMETSFYDAKRLVRTETNYVLGESTADAYTNAGVEFYKFIATLDHRTSSICRSLDQKIFDSAKKQVGVNYHPMHPNCRSTTIPYFPEYADEDPGSRIAKGADGKYYYIPANTSYTEWLDSMPMAERAAFEKQEKIHKNKSSDKNQYNRYKQVLGKNAPKSFAEFQRIKYISSDYESFQNLYNSVRTNRVWKDANFYTEKRLESHYKKHVLNAAEFGIISKEDYIGFGREILSKKIDNASILGFRTKSGFLFKYDIDKGILVIGRSDYKISTIFKPEDGILYYIAEYENYLRKGETSD